MSFVRTERAMAIIEEFYAKHTELLVLTKRRRRIISWLPWPTREDPPSVLELWQEGKISAQEADMLLDAQKQLILAKAGKF